MLHQTSVIYQNNLLLKEVLCYPSKITLIRFKYRLLMKYLQLFVKKRNL